MIFAGNLMATTITGGPQVYPSFSVNITEVTVFTCTFQGDDCSHLPGSISRIYQTLGFLLDALEFNSYSSWDSITFSASNVTYFYQDADPTGASRWGSIDGNGITTWYNYPDEMERSHVVITSATSCLYPSYNCSDIAYTGTASEVWQDGTWAADLQGSMAVSDPAPFLAPEPRSALLLLGSLAILQARRTRKLAHRE